MTKRQIFTGAIAAFALILAAGVSLAEAQGRVGGGLGGGLGGQQRMGGRQGGGRAGQMGGGRMGGARGGQMGGPLAELAQLDLSADQRAKVRDLMDADRGRDASIGRRASGAERGDLRRHTGRGGDHVAPGQDRRGRNRTTVS